MAAGAVILDSGGVLIRPTDGRAWMPPKAFSEVLTARGVDLTADARDAGLAAGREYLRATEHELVADEAAEHDVWRRYFRLMLEGAAVPGHHGEIADAIVREWVADPGVERYPWALPVLQELRERDVPVVVLSDSWPSLRRFYRDLGLDDLVMAMVISAEEGFTKPDRRMYERALSVAGCPPGDATFVDDDPDNVRAGVSLGIRGIRLREAEASPADDLDEITDLVELLALI